MMLNGYVVPADLFADTVVFRQSLWLISCSDISSVAINLHLISCHTNKWPLQMGHCVSWVPLCSVKALVQSRGTFCGKRGIHGEGAREGVGWAENRYRKSIHKSPLTFVFSVIVDCDKLALSYLKPPIGQMVRPAGRGENEMGFTTELILGAAILPTTS